MRAFDARSGKLAWEFRTVPPPGQPGHETWAGQSWRDRTGVNVWSVISVDAERGLVFLPIGSPATDFYGGDREGKNLFANSLVALDAATGRLRWHFQMVHHDIWDYDIPAQPTLVTLRRNGGVVAAIAQVTKMGLIFVLDRVTGRPIFPVEERPVPSSSVPGEQAWPTQPFPLKPPPLSRHAVTERDLNTTTARSRQYCEQLLRSVLGQRIFQPISCEATLYTPGTLGGGNWSGASFDPRSEILYVNTNELPTIAAVDCPPGGSLPSGRLKQYSRFLDESGRPCLKPPWGLLHAIDLSKGQIVWSKPLGRLEGTRQGRGRTGTANLGGSIVTAGGLVFIGATTDSKFRAFDAKTGKELWSASLEAPAHATPITYRGRRSTKQYVVIASGGGGYLSPDKLSDVVVAFALP